MTDTIATDIVIRSMDRAALRKADCIVLRTYAGVSTIECKFSGEDRSFMNERTHSIPVSGSVTDYQQGHKYVSPGDVKDYAAFTMFHSGPRFNVVLATVVGRIGNGDALTLCWIRGGRSTEGLTAGGFVADQVNLRITKPNGRVETYMVDTFAGHDNTARMVRYVG